MGPDLTDLKSKRKHLRVLAGVLREAIPEEAIAMMYIVALCGWQPVLIEDKRCNCGFRVDRGTQLTPKEHAKYFEMMQNRRNGMPAQPLVVDAQVRTELESGDKVLDASTLAAAGRVGIDPAALYAFLQTQLRPAQPTSGGTVLMPGAVTVPARGERPVDDLPAPRPRPVLVDSTATEVLDEIVNDESDADDESDED